VETIIDLRNDDELVENRGGVETIHIPLDRLDEDPDFWVDWANGPQFATPLYYRPFMERFPDRIERVLDAVEKARPGGVSSTASEAATGPAWWPSCCLRSPACRRS
jgi:protein-tyrosine phosphatase